MTEDDEISRRYRELPREEPPRHLDDAILAAARRAVDTRPAPLVVPTGRQRWYFPLAAAAIIVLAVAVTMHVEREQPGEEIVSAQTAPADVPPRGKPRRRPRPRNRSPRPSPSVGARPSPQIPANCARPRRRRSCRRRRSLRPRRPNTEPTTGMRCTGAAAARGQAVAAGAHGRRGVAASERRVAARRTRARALPVQLSAYALQSPEQWLQGIADLRRQGRHEEADKALAEFRKRYPDYRIPKDPSSREALRRPDQIQGSDPDFSGAGSWRGRAARARSAACRRSRPSSRPRRCGRRP